MNSISSKEVIKGLQDDGWYDRKTIGSKVFEVNYEKRYVCFSCNYRKREK